VPKGLPTITAVMVLNDAETGLPLAFLDGTYITGLRTVAVSAVAARHLCNPDASVMGLVGCGVQGKYHAVAMKEIVPALTTLKIHDTWEPSVKSFLEEIQPRLPDMTIEVCSSPEEAIRGADLVATATGKLLEPIYKNEWVKQGALVLPVHTLGWDSSTASNMDKLVTDDWAQFRTVGDEMYQPLPERPHAETGEIVAGLRPGRENPDERIVCFNKGLAIHDVMMASAIYEKAREKGVGTTLTIQEDGQALPMLEV
jgi:ornithine cyclodeaminase/alanine dehydrogenase-like protein (mu-crystallin family)